MGSGDFVMEGWYPVSPSEGEVAGYKGIQKGKADSAVERSDECVGSSGMCQPYTSSCSNNYGHFLD